MARVDPEKFLSWADQYFNGDLKISRNEIKANSPFIDDDDHKLWMNPSGGKKHVSAGVYRCWKTDKSGSLISLVSELSQIPYNEAEDLICSELSLATLADKLELFFNKKPEKKINLENFKLPDHTFRIADLSEGNPLKANAINYLESRKLPIDYFYLCIEGDYKNRIIIPYLDQYGNLFYYNGRLISNKKDCRRYKFPDREEVGIGKGDVIYMKEWPKPGSRIYLTEGEIDAISLNISGLYGAAIGGKSLCDEQLEMLRPYLITLAFDSDIAGREAVATVGQMLMSSGFNRIGYVYPPNGCKDWNEFLVKNDESKLYDYVTHNSKTYTFRIGNDFHFNKIKF
jgi:DNA primase